MRFEEKIRSTPQQAVWDEYCGFLDLKLEEYMSIQKRLLSEQLELMAKCQLGKRFFGELAPRNMDEFRAMVPLTTFSDYADILLLRRGDMLPAPPVVWIETTWEGGDKPFKCAPYTEEMLNTYRSNILSSMIMSTSRAKNTFRIRKNARVLYSLAPLPYATGLFPGLVDPEIKIKFLPPLREAQSMSFSARCKNGFKLAIKQGMDQFYGMTSIVYSMSKSFSDIVSGGGSFSLGDLCGMSMKMLFRLLRARYRSKRDGTPIKPGDIFRLDGFVCVGTDTALYRDELERLWGCRPLEVAGGTEPCLLGTETWLKNGLLFFPDNCFYEFIPWEDSLRSLSDPSFTPRTYLINELAAGEKYELVITSLKGGAFMRYRVGDVYRCLRLKSPHEGLDYPQFEYLDRIPTVIDIDGFTRITSAEIERVIVMSGLSVTDWLAVKEYDLAEHSLLHLYVEPAGGDPGANLADAEVFKEHLSIYFRHHDSDYNDLKRLIGVDPLKVTVLRTGSLSAFELSTGRKLKRLNTPKQDVVDLLRFCGLSGKEAER